MSRRFRSLVLCYHAVSESWEHPLAVGVGALERQLRSLLKRGYRPASIDEVAGYGGRLFHVTFDDGFRNVRAALPVLEHLRVPATIFVCTGFAERGQTFPLPELGDANGREDALATMTWDELRDVAARGITVASHTISHQHLPGLSDGELAQELSASRDAIEAFLGKPCRYLAYPFGAHDARVRAAARRAGYRAAFALPGRDHPIDVFALPRVGVWRRDGRLRMALKTSIARPSSPTLQLALRRQDGLQPSAVPTGGGPGK